MRHITEKAAVAEDAGVFGQQGTQPDGTIGHVESHHVFAGEGDCELAEEGSLPVVPVCQHQDLLVVADLEELLRASMHCADHDPSRGDHIVLGPQPELNETGLTGVFRAQVEQDGSGRHLGRLGRRQHARGKRSDQDTERLMTHLTRPFGVRLRGCDGKRAGIGPLRRTSSRL